jgi:hypothetical protein
MCRLCEVCGEILVRKKEGCRWPKKCPACRKSSDLEKERVRQSRIRNAARVENVGRWASAKCEVCSRAIGEIPRRGPFPKKCNACKRKAEANRHCRNCKHCGEQYTTRRRSQQYCSPLCGHSASQKRATVTCCICRHEFEVFPHDAPNRKFCSQKCFAESRRRWRICEGCGESFNRRVRGKFEYQDKGKYCCRDCYFDARWGSNRPKRKWSAKAIDRSCRRSIATSLRKRCKYYGKPFDPACTRKAVCDRDGWVCQQCGIQCHKGRHRFNKRTRKTSPKNAEHDHIVPLSARNSNKGNTFDNSQCLCRRCNSRKRDKRGAQLRLPFVGC